MTEKILKWWSDNKAEEYLEEQLNDLDAPTANNNTLIESYLAC